MKVAMRPVRTNSIGQVFPSKNPQNPDWNNSKILKKSLLFKMTYF